MLTTALATRRLATTTAARHTALTYSQSALRIPGLESCLATQGARRGRSTWASLAEANQTEHSEAAARGVKTVVTVKMSLSDSPAPQATAATPREPVEHEEMKEWSRAASKTMARAANLGRENLSQLLPIAEHQKVILELIEQQFALMDSIQNKLDDAVYLRDENEQLRLNHASEVRRVKLAHAAALETARRSTRLAAGQPDAHDSAIDPSLARLQEQMARDRDMPQRAISISDITFGPLRL
jgi:hypothetical protein